MSWATSMEAIRVAIATAAELPDVLGADGVTYNKAVVWENTNEAERWDTVGVQVDIRAGVVVPIGHDETRFGTDDTTGDLIPAYMGLRELTATILVTSDSQVPGETAIGEYSDRIRTRLLSHPNVKALQAANVGIVWINPTFYADFEDENGHMRSAAVTDLRFHVATTWNDEDNPEKWIETINGTGDVETLDGGQLSLAFSV